MEGYAMENSNNTVGSLYVVPTPIGNLNDLSQRIIQTLSSVDIIAAEDTRNTLFLLNHLSINKKLVSYHKFNETQKSSYLIQQLLSGKNIAVVSDAGTPCISDPGYIIVREAVLNNIEVYGICGPCAATTALSISGFDTASFVFWGFLPRKEQDIKKVFRQASLSNINVGVFYESPKRIHDTMKILSQEYPQIDVCLCNDLTKKYERIYRGNALHVTKCIEENEFSDKGEYTLVIDFTSIEAEDSINSSQSFHHLEAVLLEYIIENDCSIKDAVKILSKEGLFKRNELYDASLKLKSLSQTF